MILSRCVLATFGLSPHLRRTSTIAAIHTHHIYSTARPALPFTICGNELAIVLKDSDPNLITIFNVKSFLAGKKVVTRKGVAPSGSTTTPGSVKLSLLRNRNYLMYTDINKIRYSDGRRSVSYYTQNDVNDVVHLFDPLEKQLKPFGIGSYTSVKDLWGIDLAIHNTLTEE